MRWLWSNKEWLFSGVGIVVLGLLYRLLSNKRAAPVTNQPVNAGPSPPPPEKDSYSGEPTPDDIDSHVRSLPIYQQDAARDSYRGLKVRWPIVLFDLIKPDERARKHEQARKHVQARRHVLTAHFDDPKKKLQTDIRGGPLIKAWIDMEEFPRLKIAHQGTRMEITGSISSVSDLRSINLEDVNITFR